VRPESGRFRDARVYFSFDAFMRDAMVPDCVMISLFLSKHKFQISGVRGREEKREIKGTEGGSCASYQVRSEGAGQGKAVGLCEKMYVIGLSVICWRLCYGSAQEKTDYDINYCGVLCDGWFTGLFEPV
jgi:hypothetical protein